MKGATEDDPLNPKEIKTGKKKRKRETNVPALAIKAKQSNTTFNIFLNKSLQMGKLNAGAVI